MRLQALLLAASVAACGEPSDPALTEPTELELAREARASGGDVATLQDIDPTTTGSLRGTVRLEGTPPKRREIPRLRECGDHPEPLLDEEVIVGPAGGLADVLVHVRRGLAGWRIPPAEPETHRLDQVGCAYVPHVTALRAGQSLRVANSDALTHNVRVRAPRNGLNSNRTQARGAAELAFDFKRPELGIRVVCDLHPWMGAVVHVLDHPFHALTGDDGAFSIEGLPPGEYEVEALHPELGRTRATVVIAAGVESPLELGLALE